jgi:hypothetical protein
MASISYSMIQSRGLYVKSLLTTTFPRTFLMNLLIESNVLRHGKVLRVCPSKVLAASLAVSGASPSRRPPLVDPRAFQSVIETKYRAVWVTRSRLGVAVSSSPARSSRRLRRRTLARPASSSRTLRKSCRVSRVTRGPALLSELPSLGYRPSSRRHRSESAWHEPPQARTVPSSTFLTSSTVYSSIRLRGFVSPRCHVQGSLFRGFPRQEAVRARHPPLPSCRSRPPPSSRFDPVTVRRAPAFRALLLSPIRRSTQLFKPRPARSPPEFPLLRVFLRAR